MATVKQTLLANVKYKLPCNGLFFQLLAASAPLSLDFRVQSSSQPDLHESVPVGFWYKSNQLLSYVEVESNIAQEITYLYAMGQTGVDRSETITTLSQGSVITDTAPAVVGVASSLVLAATASRKRVIFTADSANAGTIALGGASVTLANSAILLDAGDSFIDEKAAIAEYHAIASIAAQGLRISEA